MPGYLSEIATGVVVDDYSNEVLQVISGIPFLVKGNRGGPLPAISQIDDATLCAAIVEFRKRVRILSFDERYTYANSVGRPTEAIFQEPLDRALKKNPFTIALLNKLADIVNITDDLHEYKSAVNAMCRLTMRHNTVQRKRVFSLFDETGALRPRQSISATAIKLADLK